MTKEQKEISKKLKNRHQKDGFISMLISQQDRMGGYEHWRGAFDRKKNRGSSPP